MKDMDDYDYDDYPGKSALKVILIAVLIIAGVYHGITDHRGQAPPDGCYMSNEQVPVLEC